MEKKFKILIFATLLVSSVLNAQNFEWVNQMGGPTYDTGTSITVDASGNIYTTGQFQGTIDFDPGAGTSILTSSGQSDIFVQKLDSSGNFIWAKQMGGAYNDYGHSLVVDNDGNVITTGFFNGTVDFDPGTGTSNLTSAGFVDVFVQKLDANGSFLWAKRIGGPSNVNSKSIALDDSGNIYIAGSFEGTVDFDPGGGVKNLASAGGYDIFVQKLSANGSFIWVKRMGSDLDDRGQALKVDASGNVCTVGTFSGTVDFDPGSGSNVYTAIERDVFIQKMDDEGNFLWARQIGGLSHDFAYSVAVDAFENVYTIGRFKLTVDFDPGIDTFYLASFGNSYDIFVHKMDVNGDFIWARQIGGIASDDGQSIGLDAAGNVYSTGVFYGTADFDPGADKYNMASAGKYDIFVQKMDADGNFQWARQIGGSDNEFAFSIAVDASENVYTTGNFTGTVDFDPGIGTNYLISAGGQDIFLQKLSSVTVAINDSEFASILNLYPNPTSGEFFIYLDSIYSSVLVMIFDINGDLVRSESFNEGGLIRMSIVEPEGVYLIVVETDSRRSVMRLLMN